MSERVTFEAQPIASGEETMHRDAEQTINSVRMVVLHRLRDVEDLLDQLQNCGVSGARMIIRGPSTFAVVY